MPKPSSIEALVTDNNTLPVTTSETVPTDSSKLNPSYSYSYTDGNLTSIQMTIGGVTYKKEFTYTEGKLTGETVWTQI